MTRTFSLTKHLPAVACALALAGATGCDDGGSQAPAHNARVEAGLQGVLDRAAAQRDVLLPGAIAHYRERGWAPWTGSAGLGDLAAGVPMRPGDRIRAGSIVKTFLATVTLQHVEEGALSLDQTLTELLPAAITDRVAEADRITLRMLLGHTSGIPDWVTDDVHVAVALHPERIWTTDDALEIAASQERAFPPGAAWSYSNTNYTLVGLVLDGLGEKGWRAQVRARVLDRLGLLSTRLPEPGDPSVPGAYAHGYQDVGGTPIDLSAVDPSMAGASGGNAMITTVQDLARFLEGLLAGELFARPGTLEAMTAMREASDGSGLPYRYGLGLESYTFEDGTTVVGHSGGAAGYAVMMFHVPDRHATLVTAVNESSLFTNALQVFIPSLRVIAAPAGSP
jgi:D-alanyl-D-alanine carboxypeptidase